MASHEVVLLPAEVLQREGTWALRHQKKDHRYYGDWTTEGDWCSLVAHRR